ncbi:MAG: ABC transporter permease [Chloroflexota bacterium]
MGRYMARRLLALVAALLGLSVLIFLMIRLVPGTVVEQLLGDSFASPETITALRNYFGLDKPIYIQYFEWLGKVLTGDLGTSWRTGKPVLQMIFDLLPITGELAILSVLISMVVGVSLGIISAIKQNTLIDSLTRIAALLGLSMPVFWQGTMFILLLSLYFNWMPSIVWVSFWDNPIENLKILILPALCLGTASAASVMRMTRSCMLDVLRQEYVRTARAKGLHERAVIAGHALRNAIIPVITVVGVQLGYQFGGVVVVEEVFTLNGIGRLVLSGIYQRDYPVVQGTILFIGFIFMLSNLLVDLLYGFFDPRIRYGD